MGMLTHDDTARVAAKTPAKAIMVTRLVEGAAWPVVGRVRPTVGAG
jgi:hypothetical protein